MRRRRGRDEIEADLLAWMREADFAPDEQRFEALALELFAFQFEHCEPYARFCRAQRVTPERILSWHEIPAVPTGAFKEVPLRCFPPDRTVRVFRTSGTSLDRRGELHLDTLALYEASLLPTFRRFVFPELGEGDQRRRIRVLASSPEEAPDSSLSYMFGCVVRALGDARSGFDVAQGRLRFETLRHELARAEAEGVAITLCGTAFAFVHLLETLEARGERFRLPEGSRAMETGGFKGRSRELTREELHRRIEAVLGIPSRRIVNQYGMTELGSQFYDSVLRDPEGPRRKLGPPWARVRVLDPETDREVGEGEVGVAVIVDLANTGSVLAIRTADLATPVADGFEVLGRSPGAEARGCSIAADTMLGGSAA